MSSIFGGGQTQTPDYTGLQIQTAVNTLPIPIVWGESKLAPNVIWYNNFQISGGGKGGKGGLFSSGETTYSAAVIMALCEGPIAGINQIWKNQSVYSLSQLGLTLFTGTTPQSVWSYLASAYPFESLAYQGTCYTCSSDYSLGTSATLDNHNFEVQGFFYGTGVNGLDADPAQIINDFLTNAQYGVAAPTGFPGSAIDAATLFGSGGDASYQTYCKAVGLMLSPALIDQEKASSVLDRWMKLTNTAAIWSGGQLKFIPYGDTSTVAGTQITTTEQHEIGEVPSGGANPAGITVANWAYFVADGGVEYSNSGAPLSYIGPNTWPTRAGTYSIAYVASLLPGEEVLSGTYLFAEGDEGTNVQITFTYQVAASYVPNVTPLYDLTDDDFKYDNDEDPLKVTRSDPYAAYNVWRLEVADRDNAYNLTTVESRDQNAIELYGMRIAPTVTAHEICDTNVGLISGQLQLQRSVYIRNTYQFRLSWEYCLLDPMDLVTVTDSVLGLSKAPIRITEIEEDENGFLQVTAEEFPLGVATATLYATASASSNPLNRAAVPDSANTPIIFEPPAALASAPQLWIAASGGSGGAADPNWGGANVWISLDGSTYTQIGAMTGAAAMGSLTTSLASFGGTNPDATDTLAVNLAESAGMLASADSLQAQLAATLCIVDGELLSYATATLTSANNYSLTTLYRGLFGTAVASHSSGAPFAFLSSNAIFKYNLPAQYVGRTLYIKLQSFNVFGGGTQALSACTAFTYTPTGAASAHPVASAWLTGLPMDMGNSGTPGPVDDYGTGALPVALTVDLGS
jgi:hypothetical protein